MGALNFFKVSTKAAAKHVGTEKTSSSDVSSRETPGRLAPQSTTQSSGSLALSGASLTEEKKYQLKLDYLYQQQRTLLWVRDTSGKVEGVIIRKGRNDYLFCPPKLRSSSLAHAMQIFNVQAAMTINTEVMKTFVSRFSNAVDIPFSSGLRIQILPEMSDLCRARRHHYAAFIASEGILVVWDDNENNLLHRAEDIETQLVRTIWATKTDLDTEDDISQLDWEHDEEAGEVASKARPVMHYNNVLVACSVCLLTVLIGLGYQNITWEVISVHQWTSLCFVAMTPVNAFIGMFFALVVIRSVAHLIGPIKHLNTNSKFYSAIKSPRLSSQTLPHVTIQCPVYKEGLSAVIAPTVKSLKAAISTYELQGGSANIFINDDGMQCLPADVQQARIAFYADHGIGWTARPNHGEDGFVRKGRFKKASNMNYGLALSNLVEERLQQIDRPEDWNNADEAAAYERCLLEVLEEDGKAWADGNIRVGDYILLIDCDTRVPADCLLDAVSEMEQSPQVAIIQFSSGVMQVAHNYFEDGITFFTNLIYTAIRFGVASGDVAPFVGHNAILRWSAIQEAAFCDEDDGTEKFWSESHVSEDFDMALRLQVRGYIIRLAAWAGDGFKEGVSLTVYDELTRWEKYAYGCNELVFNPIRTWLWRGPFTPLFRRFITSCLPLSSKISIIAYIGTYYAIGAAWIMTVANYVAIGLYNGYLDKWYVESWKIWLSIILVFSIVANVALAVQRYRANERSFIGSFLENFKWCCLLLILFGGMSLHVSQALLCHMFEIDMSWGATAKEVELSNFFIEVPKVARKFKYSIALSMMMIVIIIIMAEATFIPWSWNITLFVAIFPLAMLCACHLLLPIVLNPGLMTFSW